VRSIIRQAFRRAVTEITTAPTSAFGRRRSWRDPRVKKYTRSTSKSITAIFKNSIRATSPQSWGSVANLGLWSYVLGKGGNAEAVTAIRDASLKAADEIVTRTARPWIPRQHDHAGLQLGSNSGAANYGMQLLVANALKADPRYVQNGAR